jgi:hypothetical protein
MTAHPPTGRCIPTTIIAVCACLLSAASVRAQSMPTTTLSAPARTFDDPFSRVTGLRTLSDGRILVADQTEQALWMVDPATGTKRQLGRQGRGPGEYEMPAGLFAVGGDSTLMVDQLNRRLALVLPDGALSTSTIPMRLPSGVPMFPRGADAAGRIYFDLAGIMMPGLEEAAVSGRAPLLRWDPASGRVDTLGVVNFPPMEGAARPGEMRIMLGGGGPFRGRDQWAVTPDGRVGIARYQDYHVEWLAAGAAPLRGPVVAYDPVVVTTAEKDAWADAVAANGIRIEVENGRRRVGRPPRPNIESQEWPDVMPPFLDQAAMTLPNGSLAIARATAQGTERVYDVFDRTGKLIRQLRTPSDRRIVGFGDGIAYVVRVDADDLQWLEVYEL